jgi:hypothetical protein
MCRNYIFNSLFEPGQWAPAQAQVWKGRAMTVALAALEKKLSDGKELE